MNRHDECPVERHAASGVAIVPQHPFTMANNLSIEGDRAQRALRHFEQLLATMTPPFLVGQWLDPVICLVVMLLYLGDDVLLVKLRQSFMRDKNIREQWSDLAHAHRQYRERHGFTTAGDHLAAFFASDRRLGGAIRARGVLPPFLPEPDIAESLRDEPRPELQSHRQRRLTLI